MVLQLQRGKRTRAEAPPPPPGGFRDGVREAQGEQDTEVKLGRND